MDRPAPLHHVAPWAVLSLVLGAAPARSAEAASATATATSADSVPTTPERALAMAEAAFEYRDFEAVVAALDPWVHPPRIRSRPAMARARRLLGVALHIQGDERAAREEFAQLLLLDPSHRLDPFVIPPRVIVTFEEVKKQLGPSLVTEPDPPLPAPRERPSGVVALIPLGINQVLLDEPELGLTLGGLQLAGLALNVVAFWVASQVDNESAERDVWVAAQYGGLGLFGLAYGASAISGLLRVDSMSSPPPPGAAPGVQLRLRF